MQLTIGETAAVEDLAGQPIEALNDKTARKGKLIAALVTVISKRTNPDFTLEDAYAMDAGVAGKLVEDFFGPAGPGAAAPLPAGGPTSSPRSAKPRVSSPRKPRR